MERIDFDKHFKDAHGNIYHIHMTDHTRGLQQEEAVHRLCTFIFDTGINVPNMNGWIKEESSCMYLVDNQCPLFALLDHKSQAENNKNFLSFKRKGNEITINHFGPFGLHKTLKFEEIRRERENAKIKIEENESKREPFEKLRQNYEKAFPPLHTTAEKSKEWHEKRKAIVETQAKASVNFWELGKLVLEAPKAATDIAETMVKTTSMSTGVKRVPVLGFAAGLCFGVWRAVHGDFAGAGLEVASGAASLVPGFGTVVSIGIDAALFRRDLYMIQKKVKEEEEMQKALYEEEELKDWEARKDAMIRLQEKIKECKDAEDGYNHCVKGCDILIELYEAADGAKK